MTDKDKGERPSSGLGKGIHSLLGEEAGADVRPREPALVLREVDPQLIDPNPDQPRKVFRDEDLKSLAASIGQDGVIQPLVVVANKEQPGRYILIAGERRWRASQLVGLKKVPVLVKQSQRDERLRLALIENIQRADLNIIEEAHAYRNLIQRYGLTQEACAQKVGKDRSTVSNALRLLSLPAEVQTELAEGRLSSGHAKPLLGLADANLQKQAAELVVKKQLSVRKTEQLCRSLQDMARPTTQGELQLEAADQVDPDMEYIADNLRSHLRTKVKLAGNAQRGKIEISYFSSSELERLLALIAQRY